MSSDRHKQFKSIERSVDKLEGQFWDALNDVDADDHMLVIKNKIKQVRTNKTKFDKLVLPPDLSAEERAMFNQVKTKLAHLLKVIELNFGPQKRSRGPKLDKTRVERLEKRLEENLGKEPKEKRERKAEKLDTSKFHMFSEIMHRMGAVE